MTAKRRFIVIFEEREESSLDSDDLMDMLNHGQVPSALDAVKVEEQEKNG